MTEPKVLIELTNGSLGKGGRPVLQNLHWRLIQGENWVITGPMACGKTTLAQILAGHGRLLSGTLSYPFLGEQPTYEAKRKAIRFVCFADTGKLFKSPFTTHYYQQRYHAFDADGHATVSQLLGLDQVTPSGDQNTLLHTLGVAPLLHKECIKLSSGQSRRTLLAKALLQTPQILILDNAHLGLDVAGRKQLNALLDEVVIQSGVSLILVGHFESLPACVGRVWELGAVPRKLSAGGWETLRQGDIETGILGAAKVFGRQPGDGIDKLDRQHRIDQEALQGIKEYYEQHRPRQGVEEVISMKNVKVSYGQTRILQDFSWQVKTGEKWAVVGPNGAGKSTLLSLIYADNPQAYANEIYLFGLRRGPGQTIWQIKNRIGFTSSELHAYFDADMPALKLVLTGLYDAFVLVGKPGEQEVAFAMLLFRYFGISHFQDQYFHTLSTGVQRLLFLLRALVKAPELLLLDEPFQGFDEATIYKSRLLLDTVLTKRHSLVFITHEEGELPQIDNFLKVVNLK